MKVVIIGSSAASKSAVETLLAEDREVEVTVITRDEKSYYSRVLLPNYIAGEISEDGLRFVESDFLLDPRLKLIKGTATAIDTENKAVIVEDHGKVGYDCLIIATGASPSRLENLDANLDGICYLRDFEDAVAIKERAVEAEKCAVLGGGLVSLKAAWALKELGKDVTLIVESGQLLSQVMDQRAARMVKDLFENNGIRVLLNSGVEKFISDKGRLAQLKLKDGQILECGLAVVGKGVRPNLNVVKGTEIVVDSGVLVNEKMQTSVKDIYAAGDVAQSASLLTQGPSLFTIWPDAAYQGRVAAANILGINQNYTGGISMNSVVFFGVPFISIGLVRERDITECEVYVNDSDKGVYRKIVVKDGRLKGAVLAGDISFAGMVYWDIKSGRKVDDPLMYLTRHGLEDLYLQRNRQLGWAWRWKNE